MIDAKVIPIREARARLRPDDPPVPLEAFEDFDKALRVWRLKHAQRMVRALAELLSSATREPELLDSTTTEDSQR